MTLKARVTKSVRTAFLVGLLAVLSFAETPPSIDKQKIAEYLSYAEGFTPAVKITVGDPEPTALVGYYRLVVHLTLGDTKEDKTYYLTADGKHLVGEPIWDLTQSPFLATAGRIPTDGPSFGPNGAKVTIVVFNDFQCPYCRKFATTLRDQLPKKYPQDVRVIFQDFPIGSIHPWAPAAAEAGRCVGDARSDTFWAFHDWIFEHQGEIQKDNLREKVLGFGKAHGLSEQLLTSCLDSHSKAAEVEASLKQGRELGIDQTPTFFLNGRRVPGALPWESLDTLIQMELHRPASIPAAPLERATQK